MTQTHLGMPVVAILGQWRSGTSALAGILHHLGFYFGEAVGLLGDHVKHRNTWEAVDLVQIMLRCYRQPDMQALLPPAQITALLGSWITQRREAASAKGFRGVAMKHPALSVNPSLLRAAAPEIILLRTEREVEDSWRSMQRIGWEWPQRAAREGLLRQCRGAIDSGARAFAFPDYLHDPRRTVEQVIDCLGISTDSAAVQAAVASLHGDR